MRNRVYGAALILILTALVVVFPVAAQEGEAATFHSDVTTNLERVGRNMISLAEATPENMFGWRATKDVRSVSEVYMHTVASNVLIPVGIGGPKPDWLEVPEEGGLFALFRSLESDYTTKAEVIEWLKKSFDYAVNNLAAIEDLETEVKLLGFPGTKRAYILIVLSHAHEHLGQSIAYARSIGVVPPWSRQQQTSDDDGE